MVDLVLLEVSLGVTQDIPHETELGSFHGRQEDIHYVGGEHKVEALTVLGHVAVEVLLGAEAGEQFLGGVKFDLARSFNLY